MKPQGYPTWVYRCRKRENGTVVEDGLLIDTPQGWEEAEREGFVYGGPQVAREQLETLERLVSDAAAEAAFSARKMSKKAKAEYDRREAESEQHVTE